MDYNTIVRMAEYYGTTIDYILRYKIITDERQLISHYWGLPKRGKIFILYMTSRVQCCFR